MCRIMLMNNPNMSYEELELLMSFLANDSGGHGAGLCYMENDKLHAVKSSKWNDRYAPYMAGVLHILKEHTEHPILFHTRLASVGKVSNFYTHPIILSQHRTHHDTWKSIQSVGEKKETLYWIAEDIEGAIVHNGTLNKMMYKMASISFSQNHPDVRSSTIRHLSDTQLMAAMIYENDDIEIPVLFDDYGVVIVMENRGGKPSYFIERSTARTLYLVYWNENSWMIVSNIPRILYDKFPEVRSLPELEMFLPDILENRESFNITAKKDLTFKGGR